jgi:hypothetical protein
MDELRNELDGLQTLVASIEPVNAALRGHSDPHVRRYVSLRRRFDYAAFVVGLYASFETFVENLITAFVRLESKRVPYSALPKGLTEKHRVETAELLRRGRLGEGRYVGMSDLGVIRNLFECLNGTTPYTLNEFSIVAHDANLRASEIDRLFTAIDIKNICDQARRTDPIKDWYCAAHDLPTPPQYGVESTVVVQRLNDIVERRNEVAHRGGNPENLLGGAEMNEALRFIEAFARSIFELVVGRYLQNHHVASTGRIELTLRGGDGPYNNDTVIIVEKPTQRLFVGQPVFVILESAGARWGRIRSLRIDDVDVTEVAANANVHTGVGVGLDFKFPRSTEAKLLAPAAEDDVVWSR